MKQLFKSFCNILFHFFPVLGTIQLERLVNEPGNEMWRVGGGFHGYRRYFRIDIGSRGWRWTRAFDWCTDYYANVYKHCTPDNQKELDLYFDELLQEGVANESAYKWHVVTRGGNMTIRERVDLYPKLWAKGKSFQRIVYMK